jgi:hypothetical protein
MRPEFVGGGRLKDLGCRLLLRSQVACSRRGLHEISPLLSNPLPSTFVSSRQHAIPPLRERRAEIPELARRFVAEACEAQGRSLLPIAPTAMAVLENLNLAGKHPRALGGDAKGGESVRRARNRSVARSDEMRQCGA